MRYPNDYPKKLQEAREALEYWRAHHEQTGLAQVLTHMLDTIDLLAARTKLELGDKCPNPYLAYPCDGHFIVAPGSNYLLRCDTCNSSSGTFDPL